MAFRWPGDQWSGCGGLKLVDRTGYLEDAWQEAKDLAGVKDAAVIEYSRPAPPDQIPLASVPGLRRGPSGWEIDIADRLMRASAGPAVLFAAGILCALG